jgi:hypothetical protein
MGEMDKNKNPSIRNKDFIGLMDYTITQKAVDPCFANSAGYVLSGSKQCCDRTLDLINEEMCLELVASSSSAVEPHLAGM